MEPIAGRSAAMEPSNDATADATAASSAPSDPAAAEPAAASPAVPAAPLKRAADVRQGIALVLETIRAAPPDEAFTVFAILNYQHSDDAAPRQGRWKQLEKPLRFSCTARELADIAALSRFGLAVDFLNHHHQAPGASQPWMDIATRVLDGGGTSERVLAKILGRYVVLPKRRPVRVAHCPLLFAWPGGMCGAIEFGAPRSEA